MKRNLIFSLFVALTVVSNAQSIRVWKDGSYIEFAKTVVDSVTFVRNESINSEVNIGSYEYVDLELPSGTLWATKNVGADNITDLGNIFRWGETEPYIGQPYKYYSSGSYTDADGFEIAVSGCTKYTHDGYMGYSDDLTVLELEDDAAFYYTGDGITPTYSQISELHSYCQWEKSTLQGVTGYKITSKLNGKFIFIPIGSKLMASNLDYNKDCTYYNVQENLSYGWTTIYNDEDRRTHTMHVRPVNKDRNANTFVDLGLPSGNLWATKDLGADFSYEEMGTEYYWGEANCPDGTLNYAEYVQDGDYTFVKFKKYINSANSDYVYYGYPEGFYDDKTELDKEDDIAYLTLGEGWRIPSVADFQELFDNCELIIEEFRKVFKSKINSKYIEFSAFNYGSIYEYWRTKDCYYGTRDLYTGDDPFYNIWYYANSFKVDAGNYAPFFEPITRDYRTRIRPVYNNR